MCTLQVEREDVGGGAAASFASSAPGRPAAALDLNISGDEAYARRARHAWGVTRNHSECISLKHTRMAFLLPRRISKGGSGFSSGPPGSGTVADVDPKGMTLAAKMMQKMGWKVSSGFIATTAR